MRNYEQNLEKNLLEAAKGNKEEDAIEALQAGALVNHQSDDWGTATHYAALKGNIKLFIACLHHGANVDKKTKEKPKDLSYKEQFISIFSSSYAYDATLENIASEIPEIFEIIRKYRRYVTIKNKKYSRRNEKDRRRKLETIKKMSGQYPYNSLIDYEIAKSYAREKPKDWVNKALNKFNESLADAKDFPKEPDRYHYETSLVYIEKKNYLNIGRLYHYKYEIKEGDDAENFYKAGENYRQALRIEPTYARAKENLEALQKLREVSLSEADGYQVNTEHYEYAFLSNLAYETNMKERAGQLDTLTYSNWVERLSTDDIPFDDTRTCSFAGFYAVVFSNDSRRQVVISIRGTEADQNGDLAADLLLVLNKAHPQFLISEVFSKEVFKRLPMECHDYKVVYTGHSLGAVFAEVRAWEDECYAITFDSPGSKETIEYLNKKTISSLDDLQVEERNSRILTYLGAPNFINTAATHIGSMFRLYFSSSVEEDLGNTMTYKDLFLAPIRAAGRYSAATVSGTTLGSFKLLVGLAGKFSERDYFQMFNQAFSEASRLVAPVYNLIVRDYQQHKLENFLRIMKNEINYRQKAMKKVVNNESWPSGQTNYFELATYLIESDANGIEDLLEKSNKFGDMLRDKALFPYKVEVVATSVNNTPYQILGRAEGGRCVSYFLSSESDNAVTSLKTSGRLSRKNVYQEEWMRLYSKKNGKNGLSEADSPQSVVMLRSRL